MSQVDVFFTEPGEVINAKLQVAQAREQVAKIAAKASLHADSDGPKDPVWRELQKQLACLQTAAAQAIRQVKRNVGQKT